MLAETKVAIEYHPNGTLWFTTYTALIERGFGDEYPRRLIRPDGRSYVKLKCEKFYDNGQFAWSLEWDESGGLLNKDASQYRKDGTLLQY